MRLSWLSLFALASGCSGLTRIGGGDEACVPVPVQAAFDRSCATPGCHDAGGAGVDLVLTAGRSASIIGRTASQKALPLVAIGDPAGSYLAHKLMEDPPEPIAMARMPPGFDGSNEAQASDVTTILAWIAGAPFPACDGGSDTSDTVAGSESSSDTGTPITSDLPCEIEALLDQRCSSCHGDPLVGAPMPLLTRDDLLAPSNVDAAMTVGERSLARMLDTTIPMPPLPGTPVPADEIAIFEAWLTAGMPAEECASETTGGTVDDPFDVEPRCSSATYWDPVDDDGSPLMSPGRDCVGCHADERADDPDDEDIPDLVIAGTLYATGHEPDNCNGSDSADLRVIVASMASGAEVSLAPNSAGNFLLHRSEAPADFTAPFSVKVMDGDRERIMPTPAPSGACNSCHTQDGTMNAPGRVVIPY